MEQAKRSDTITIFFLLILLGGLSTLLYYAYLQPEVLGLEVQETGVLSHNEPEWKPETTRPLKLYFATEQLDGLVPELRDLSDRGDPIDLAVRLVDALADGPAEPGNTATLPEGTKALAVYMVEDSLVVDLSREIAQNSPGGLTQERNAIQSLTHTLTGLPGIRKVQYLVGHQPVDTLTGHLNLRVPVYPDLEILRQR